LCSASLLFVVFGFCAASQVQHAPAASQLSVSAFLIGVALAALGALWRSAHDTAAAALDLLGQIADGSARGR
jgi:predicted acyltransferase